MNQKPQAPGQKIFLLLCSVSVASAIGCGHSSKSASETQLTLDSTKSERIETVLKAAEPEPCASSREYITTLEFLREHMDLVGNEPAAREVADKVSLGCTGAALRFINVALVLNKTELDNPTIVKTAIDYARSDEASMKAFLSIFQKCYLPGYLDLDFTTSLRHARNLSEGAKSFASEIADAEFSNYVNFCLSKDFLDLPKPKCAEWAVQMAGLTLGAKKPLFRQFQDLYDFLRDQKEQSLSVAQTLEVITQILKGGVEASPNFMQAYKYSLSDKGLKSTQKEALEFGLRMASRTRPARN